MAAIQLRRSLESFFIFHNKLNCVWANDACSRSCKLCVSFQPYPSLDLSLCLCHLFRPPSPAVGTPTQDGQGDARGRGGGRGGGKEEGQRQADRGNGNGSSGTGDDNKDDGQISVVVEGFSPGVGCDQECDQECKTVGTNQVIIVIVVVLILSSSSGDKQGRCRQAPVRARVRVAETLGARRQTRQEGRAALCCCVLFLF